MNYERQCELILFIIKSIGLNKIKYILLHYIDIVADVIKVKSKILVTACK